MGNPIIVMNETMDNPMNMVIDTVGNPMIVEIGNTDGGYTRK